MALFDKDVNLVVPQTVELERFDPDDPSFQEGRRAAIAEGEEDFESVTSFITRINEFNAEAQRGLQEKALPGFAGLQQQLVAQASADLTDPFNLPEGVRSLLQTEAAQRGVTTGVSLRDEAGQTELLRDFGLTAFDLANQRITRAQNLFSTLVSTSPTASAVSPFAFLQTGQQRAGEDIEQSRLEFEADRDFKIRTQQIQQDAANVAAAVQNQQEISNRGTLLGDIAEIGLATGQIAATAFSDRRLKKNITRTGIHDRGFGIYTFRYIWDADSAPLRQGYMADEVIKVLPEAVGKIGEYFTINYSMI